MTKKIILGTAQFGMKYGINNKTGKIPFNEIKKILDLAYQNRINTIDTAQNYGNSERQIGKYLEMKPENKFRLITKISKPNVPLEKQISKSLINLKSKKLHAILFHSIELYEKFKKELPFLIKHYKGKYFEQIGVSLYKNKQISNIIDDKMIDRVQLPFNMFDNSNLREGFILKLKLRGKYIDARSVFLQGLFFKKLRTLPKPFKDLNKDLNFLHKLCKESNNMMNSLAINYVLEKGYIDQVIIGIDSLEQLKSNIEQISIGISEEIIKEIDSIQIKNPEMLDPSLWPKY